MPTAAASLRSRQVLIRLGHAALDATVRRARIPTADRSKLFPVGWVLQNCRVIADDVPR
jgi:hypothetical protein